MATEIKRVWETSDGRLFRDRAIAKRHDAWLELHRYAEVFVQHGCATDEGAADWITGQLIEHADDIQRILRAKPEQATDKTTAHP